MTIRDLFDAGAPHAPASAAAWGAAISDDVDSLVESGIKSLDDIQDVEVPTPADGESLVWVDAGARWEAGVRATEGYVDGVASEASTVEEATTSRTLQLSDKGKIVECTHVDPSTVTVPPNSSVAFPVGTLVGVYAAGAGGVTVAEGTGVTVRNLAVVDRYGEASLRYRGSDEWVQV